MHMITNIGGQMGIYLKEKEKSYLNCWANRPKFKIQDATKNKF